MLVGLDLPSADGGTEAGVVSPHQGNSLSQTDSERADLWQSKWNEKQIVLAPAMHTLERDASSLEGAAAGSWSLGIVEQSQGEGC